MATGKYREWPEPDGLMRLQAWARDGLTDEQMIGKMGIGKTTFYKWQQDHRAIRDAIKRGKEVVDIEVENALFKRALGYEYDEEKEEYEDGTLTKRTVTRKQMAPDVAAIIFWLKNRKVAFWRDKQITEVTTGTESINEAIVGSAELINNPRPNRVIESE